MLSGSLPLALFPVKSGSASGGCSSAHEPTRDLNSAVRVRYYRYKHRISYISPRLDRRTRGFVGIQTKAILCSYSNVILGIVSPLLTATQSTLLPSVFVAHKKKVINCLGSRPMICSTCIGKQQESALKIREVRASWLEQSLGNSMRSPR